MNEAGVPLIVLAQVEGDVEHAAPSTGEVGHAAKEPFPPFDATFFPSQLLWLAITFVALYVLVARVVLPRIGGILEDRRDRIADDLDQAERLKQQSDEALAAYERALAKARTDATSIGEKARQAAKAAAAAKQAETEAELNQRLAVAEERIDEIKRKALAEVDAVAADVAGAVVEALLGRRPTAAEVGAAVAAAGRNEADDA